MESQKYSTCFTYVGISLKSENNNLFNGVVGEYTAHKKKPADAIIT